MAPGIAERGDPCPWRDRQQHFSFKVQGDGTQETGSSVQPSDVTQPIVEACRVLVPSVGKAKE